MNSTRLPSLRFSFAARCLTALFTLSACLALTAQAETSAAPTVKKTRRFAIGAQAGTAGYGPVVTFSASKRFTVSVGYTWLSFDHDVDDDDTEYDGKLKFSNVQALLNWHPFAGTFHLSGGAFLSDNKVSVIGKLKPNATYSLGDSEYTAAEVGTLSGNVELIDGIAPYLGLGWSKAPLKGGLGFFLDIGVLFIDAPQARLSASGGSLSNHPTLQQNLRQEEKDLNDDIDTLRFYPVIQMGLVYRF